MGRTETYRQILPHKDASQRVSSSEPVLTFSWVGADQRDFPHLFTGDTLTWVHIRYVYINQYDILPLKLTFCFLFSRFL